MNNTRVCKGDFCCGCSSNYCLNYYSIPNNLRELPYIRTKKQRPHPCALKNTSGSIFNVSNDFNYLNNNITRNASIQHEDVKNISINNMYLHNINKNHNLRYSKNGCGC